MLALDDPRRTFARVDTGNTALVEIIRHRIRDAGPVSFAWLMEQALYQPEHGYYSSGRAVIGRRGDYFTNVSVGPVFGRLMARQFAEMWRVLGEPPEFTIVEQGAHDGQFAHDVMTSVRDEHPDFAATLHYRIVEPFVRLRPRQQETLGAFRERVSWIDSLEELKPFSGVHFSNELLDSFPRHVVRWNGSEWLERHVDVDGKAFVFVDVSISDDELRRAVERLPRLAAADYVTEINLGAQTWIDAIAKKLAKGFVVAVDYGFPRDEFYAPHRTSGTLQSYAAHRVLPSPLMNLGEADISAHVEWTSIAARAEARGLRVAGFTDQHHFITGLLAGPGGAELIQNADAKTQRALQTLLHPGFLGMKFQFLVLAKGIDEDIRLSGLQFGRDARTTLGLDGAAER
jgi:SAM-dependent MidA family methyltransferase